MNTICIFGDSITWGARLPFRVGWANLLRNYIENATEDYYSVYDLGIDGNTSKNLLKRFDVEAEARKPEIIVFAIGINDSVFHIAPHENDISLQEFESNLSQLVQKARHYTNNIFFVGLAKGSDELTVPLVRSSTGKCYDKEHTVLYNECIKTLSKKEHVYFIDIFDVLNAGDFDDGLHPNSIGHEKICHAVQHALLPVLQIQEVQQITLVDAHDEIIGYTNRSEVTLKDIVRVSALWITNSHGDILLARRAFTKRRDPGKWGPAAARMLEKDESYEDAVKKAAREELHVTNFAMKSVKKIFVTGERAFYCSWFATTIDAPADSFLLHAREVMKVQWMTKDAVVALYKENPGMFVQSFGDYLSLFS